MGSWFMVAPYCTPIVLFCLCMDSLQVTLQRGGDMGSWFYGDPLHYSLVLFCAGDVAAGGGHGVVVHSDAGVQDQA